MTTAAGLLFPTSEDIIDCMKDTGLFEDFNQNVSQTDDDLDEFMNNFNESEFNISIDDFPNEVINWTCFPDPPVFEDSRTSTFEFITVGLLLTLISSFGLVGNIVAIIVLSRPAMKGSFSSLLIGLSSFDLLYLAIGIAIFGLPALSTSYHDLILPFIMPVGFGIGHIGRVGSVFVTVSVTIERYFAIVHPLKHFSGKRYLLVTPIVTSVLYNIPKFFEFRRSEANMVEETDLRANKAYAVWYIFWSKFILIEVIPYLTIVILNSAIVRKIWKSNKFRRRFMKNGSQKGSNNLSVTAPSTTPATTGANVTNANGGSRINVNANQVNQQQSLNRIDVIESVSVRQNDTGETNNSASTSNIEQGNNGTSSAANQIEMTARQRREANLGIVLVSISVLFILCQSVKIVPDLYEVFYCRIGTSGLNNDGLCLNDFTIDSIIDISHLFLAINSSVNVIIYTLRGEKFREVLTTTFGLENWLSCPPRGRVRQANGDGGRGREGGFRGRRGLHGTRSEAATTGGEAIPMINLYRTEQEPEEPTQIVTTTGLVSPAMTLNAASEAGNEGITEEEDVANEDEDEGQPLEIFTPVTVHNGNSFITIV